MNLGRRMLQQTFSLGRSRYRTYYMVDSLTTRNANCHGWRKSILWNSLDHQLSVMRLSSARVSAVHSISDSGGVGSCIKVNFNGSAAPSSHANRGRCLSSNRENTRIISSKKLVSSGGPRERPQQIVRAVCTTSKEQYQYDPWFTNCAGELVERRRPKQPHTAMYIPVLFKRNNPMCLVVDNVSGSSSSSAPTPVLLHQSEIDTSVIQNTSVFIGTLLSNTNSRDWASRTFSGVSYIRNIKVGATTNTVDIDSTSEVARVSAMIDGRSDGEIGIYAVEVDGELALREAASSADGEMVERFVAIRSLATSGGLHRHEAELLAYASSMVTWRRSNKYCGKCGAEMVLTSHDDDDDGGDTAKLTEKQDDMDPKIALQCSTACDRTVYPRIDPVVIVLVSCGDYVLLGRNKRWNTGRYSLLAGFMELGEDVERAIAREVMEESGVSMDWSSGSGTILQYVSSQAWPFPRSLMMGFRVILPNNQMKTLKGMSDERGEYSVSVPPDTSCNDGELEDARWFHKKFLKIALKSIEEDDYEEIENFLPNSIRFNVPGKYATARVVLDKYISDLHDDYSPYSTALDEVEDVKIEDGVFKYVLMRVSDSAGASKLIVRGGSRFEYHMEIYNYYKVEALTKCYALFTGS